MERLLNKLENKFTQIIGEKDLTRHILDNVSRIADYETILITKKDGYTKDTFKGLYNSIVLANSYDEILEQMEKYSVFYENIEDFDDCDEGYEGNESFFVIIDSLEDFNLTNEERKSLALKCSKAGAVVFTSTKKQTGIPTSELLYASLSGNKVLIKDEDNKFNLEYRMQKNFEMLASNIDFGVTFNDIAGYDEVKDELLLIKSWWDRKDELEAEGVSLPHSFLLYGPMGTGKSLFAKAFTSFFPDAVIFKIDGTHSEECDEITEKFNLARSVDGIAIILIDEIDLISRGEVRNLLTELDGLGGNNENIFIIATCNEIDDLYPPLLRRGRLDYIIGLGNPNTKERVSLLKYYFKKSGIDENQDYDYIAYITKGENAVNIKAIANEIRLRYGKNPTLFEIEDIVDKINKRELRFYGNEDEKDKDDRYLISIHEAGHAIVAMEYQKYFTFYKATLEENSLAGGMVKVLPTKGYTGDLNRALADLDISLGGYYACKILCNYLDSGAVSDIEKARYRSASLVNTYGYKGLTPLLCHNARGIPTSPFKKYKNEKMSEKILKKAEKRVTKIIKRNRNSIITLANMLNEKGVLTIKDIKGVLNA